MNTFSFEIPIENQQNQGQAQGQNNLKEKKDRRLRSRIKRKLRSLIRVLKDRRSKKIRRGNRLLFDQGRLESTNIASGGCLGGGCKGESHVPESKELLAVQGPLVLV